MKLHLCAMAILFISWTTTVRTRLRYSLLASFQKLIGINEVRTERELRAEDD